jgi:hypothetical protein
MDNVNEGTEQDVVNGDVDKLPTVDEVANEVSRLVREMGTTTNFDNNKTDFV